MMPPELEDAECAVGGLSLPRMVYMELFAACDMLCPMCVTLPYREGKRRMLSRRFIRENILEPCAILGMKQVVFGGGEPSLRNDFLDILSDAAELNYAIWFATNLLRYDDKKLENLVLAMQGERNTIAVSYDSVVPEEMNAIRGVSVFDSVDAHCRNLVRLRDQLGSRVSLVATITIQPENIHSAERTISHVLSDLGFDFVQVYLRHDYKSIDLQNYRRQEPSVWVREHDEDLIRLGLKLYTRAMREPRLKLMGTLAGWIRFVRSPQTNDRPCDAKRMLFFNAEGLLRSCMFGVEYGDIRNDDVTTILGSQAYRQARTFLETCRICHLRCG